MPKSSNIDRSLFHNPEFFRKTFRGTLLFKVTLRKLNCATFSVDETNDTFSFIDAFPIAFTFVQFHHRFLSDRATLSNQALHLLTPDRHIVAVACELFAPFLNPTASLSDCEFSAQENFTAVMKNVLKTRCYTEYTNLTDEVYDSIPAYGTSATASFLKVPITKLENVDILPTGDEPNLSLENLCHFLILCSYHQKIDLQYLQYHTLINILVALTKSLEPIWSFNQIVSDEIKLDANLNNETRCSLESLFVKEIVDDASVSLLFHRLLTFLPDSLLKLKLALQSAVKSRLKHYHVVNAAIERYPDFPWVEIVKLIREDCAAFLEARIAVRSDDNYSFRSDLGVAKKQNYRRLCYVGEKLELKAGSDVRKVSILLMPRNSIRDRLDTIIDNYFLSGAIGVSSAKESEILTPELKQLYEGITEKQI